jgi:ectoine hydroxylase-related dioxygenase (phytanoyl-CoA dioxygenase family)
VLPVDGYIRMPGLLAPTELPRFRAGVAAVLAKPVPDGCERPHNTLAPLRWCDAPVASFLCSARLTGAVIRAIGAGDLRWTSGYVSIKDPGSPPLWWHQDWWCWDHPVSFRREAAQVALLCYLGDTDRANGALRVLPGSHRQSVSLHASLPEAHAQSAKIEEGNPALRPDPDEVTLQMRAGDAVIIDYRLLHGTHANTSRRRRDCLILNFAPAWNALPPDIRAHLIRSIALPQPGDREPSVAERSFLPAFEGPRRDLPLSRTPPADFVVA